jgi:hypothetical protein
VEEELDFPFAMTWINETVDDSGNRRWRLRKVDYGHCIPFAEVADD